MRWPMLTLSFTCLPSCRFGVEGPASVQNAFRYGLPRAEGSCSLLFCFACRTERLRCIETRALVPARMPSSSETALSTQLPR